MSSFQGNIFHGPSISRKSNRVKELYKQLFGSDSEEASEQEENTETTQHSGNESERDDDVLDITADNVFVTPTKESSLPNTPTIEYASPSKVHELAQERPLISPLAKTPQPKTPLFPTSPYSIRTKTPSPTHSNARYSNLHVIVHNDTRYHQYVQHQLHVKEIGNTPLKCIIFKPYELARGRQSQHQQHSHAKITSEHKPHSTEHQPKCNCEAAHSSSQQLHAHSKQFREPQHRSATSTHYQHTNKQTQHQKQATAHARAHTNTRYNSQTHTPASSLKQKERVRRNSGNRYMPYKTNTQHTLSSTVASSTRRSVSNNNKQQQSNERPGFNVCVDDSFDESLPSFVKENRHIRSTSATGPIAERHNFERDIRIEVNNNNNNNQRPINQVEQKIVDSLESKVENSTSDGTRVIDLRNKNVPKGIHLAIAVDANKFYSKNALKKATRDLAKQFL